MEKGEPALVPEWLKSTGSTTGSGSSAPHFSSSSPDGPLSPHAVQNRSTRSLNDKDSPRSSFLDRSFSTNSRRSAISNGSAKHPYSSFSRNHRDKNRDKEKERSVVGDYWDNDSSDPLQNFLNSWNEKDALRRSQSMVSRKPGEVLIRRAPDSKNGGNYHSNGNGIPSGGGVVNGMQNAAFKKDFPSLGAEEKTGVPGIVRVPSPGLSMAIQSLPVGSSVLIGGEGWTSVLAEVPAIIGNHNVLPSPCAQQNIAATPASGASSAGTSLNMAETLSQAPARAHAIPQLPDKSQRLEELAIKQSRQLIPMTPSFPKALALSSSDKAKPKIAVRAGETAVASKNSPQLLYSSQLVNQSVRSGQVRSDAPKTSNAGKFLVLKPVRDTGTSSSAKDASAVTSNASKRAPTSQIANAPLAQTASSTGTSNPKITTGERKITSLMPNPVSIVEKKSSLSQAQSRNDFFNLMRKKTSVNSAAVRSESAPAFSSSHVEKPIEIKEVYSAPVTPRATENGSEVMSNGNTNEDVTENGSEVMSNGNTSEDGRKFSDKEKNLCLNGAVYPDEEEAAFLRSLGWEENGGEDEGLTEEEIDAFYQEYMKSRPTLKVFQGTRP